jgi:hypothetical protein
MQMKKEKDYSWVSYFFHAALIPYTAFFIFLITPLSTGARIIVTMAFCVAASYSTVRLSVYLKNRNCSKKNKKNNGWALEFLILVLTYAAFFVFFLTPLGIIGRLILALIFWLTGGYITYRIERHLKNRE